jgi:hypothetical protein
MLLSKFIISGTELTCPKWRNATKKNVKNHSCTPDINFLGIVSLQHLWGHIIRTSNNFSELFAYTKSKLAC